ncbi:MAG: hypothetical protein AAF184_13610 [Pseudomonadota bacterium]
MKSSYAPPLAGFLLVCLTCLCPAVHANDFTSAAIAKRHPQSATTPARIADARMQGECLVGLKELNFRKANEFDPVAEWTNYRSLSLLSQFPPCEVLVMMEVARTQLKALLEEE